MENKYLKKVQKKLPHLFSYFKEHNVLVISEDKATLPFAYLIHDEENHPDFLLLCLAVDFALSDIAVDIALTANTVKRVALSESFFISKSGNTYLGPEAHDQFQLEVELPLENLEPISEYRH